MSADRVATVLPVLCSVLDVPLSATQSGPLSTEAIAAPPALTRYSTSRGRERRAHVDVAGQRRRCDFDAVLEPSAYGKKAMRGRW